MIIVKLLIDCVNGKNMQKINKNYHRSDADEQSTRITYGSYGIKMKRFI